MLKRETQPSRNSLGASSPEQRIVLCIDFDYFFAQCEELRNPSLKGKPIVICVYSGRTPTSGAVSTANYIARKLGVKSGIPIVQAMKILKDQKGAAFIPMDHEYYETLSEEIMDSLRERADSFEQVSVDEAFLDITARSHSDYGNAEIIGKEIKEEIRERHGLACTIGIGPNKLVSKMAADSAKPDGFRIVRPNEVEQFLKDLPVGKLIGIGPKTEKTLNQNGIKTIGHLAVFPEDKLSELFGKNLGPLFRRMARGEDNDPVRERFPKQFSKIITLKENASTFNFRDDVEPIAKVLSVKLNQTGFKSKTIGIIVITPELKTKTRSKTLSYPTSSEEEIFSIASQLFQEAFGSQGEETLIARRIGVRVANFEEKTKRVGDETESLSKYIL
jgi:DNA polymerase IV (DinB-like DNA polymerase)